MRISQRVHNRYKHVIVRPSRNNYIFSSHVSLSNQSCTMMNFKVLLFVVIMSAVLGGKFLKNLIL